MLNITIENKNIKHIHTTKVQNKLKVRIPEKSTGHKYYVTPVPPTCPIVTDGRFKKENLKLPESEYFKVDTTEIRIYEIPSRERHHLISVPTKWERQHILLIPFENNITVEYDYEYIREKENPSRYVYASQREEGDVLYCSTDNQYQLYSNNSIKIFNPKHNITQKRVNKQRKVFVPSGTENAVIFC